MIETGSVLDDQSQYEDGLTTGGSQANLGKPLRLLLLGEASALLGARELRVPWSQRCATLGEFLTLLSQQYEVPVSTLMRSDFRFAHNARLITGDAAAVQSLPLAPGDEVAILPPVTGG
jgi:molybdopterin converting factor small subunit